MLAMVRMESVPWMIDVWDLVFVLAGASGVVITGLALLPVAVYLIHRVVELTTGVRIYSRSGSIVTRGVRSGGTKGAGSGPTLPVGGTSLGGR